jgi:hypothetical protein
MTVIGTAVVKQLIRETLVRETMQSVSPETRNPKPGDRKSLDRLILSKSGDSIRVRCPAKVNLFLKVLGKRSDGYHEVQNVMQTVSLFR